MLDRLLIVGGKGGTHVGDSFRRAAFELGIDVKLIDTAQAFRASKIHRYLFWRLSRRPPRLTRFGHNIVTLVKEYSPDLVLTTGIAPVSVQALQAIRADGIKCVNFLTDDPWNPKHYASWFVRAIQCYGEVFTPRRSNVFQLEEILPGHIHYLPFGYDPSLFYRDLGLSKEEYSKVVFVGTGDSDRYPLMRSLYAAGVPLVLYGSYWEKDPVLASLSQGQSGVTEVRQATSRARLSICLVRRRNRDGHAMRSFEIPACGAPMLVEYTTEHEEIFGEEGECVHYFYEDSELPAKAKELWSNTNELKRIALASYDRITNGRNTYRSRLENIVAYTN